MTWREEFRTLPHFHKLSAIAEALLIPTLILFLGSSLIVGVSFATGIQPHNLTKKAFLFGFGASTGLFMIACGAMMEGDARSQAELERLNSTISNQPSIEGYRCKTCKYYSWSSALPCAVNPSVALTKEAENCGDWEARS